MKPTSEAHVAQQSPAVAEVAAGDGQTPFVIQDMLAGRWARRWATATAAPTATPTATSDASHGGQEIDAHPAAFPAEPPCAGRAPPPPTG
ncbi:DUF6207 family protein [Streptomyces massasporeus]|uniref:DUF6207 family protein n=1 Tax=Streptomyces massasporeus TaxID=67324 RepID=UPI0036CECA37